MQRISLPQRSRIVVAVQISESIDYPVRVARAMPSVQPCEIPQNSFLRKYGDGVGFADCYVTDVPGTVSQAAFIEAFYTSPLFKLERTMLWLLASKRATDADAQLLAAGMASKFSAWHVEAQSSSEVLLADMTGRTRSWLMALPIAARKSAPRTRLYFGSAVVPQPCAGRQKASMGWLFHALLGFHRQYSRLLLRAAGRRLR
jgi:hypothetical protein